MDGHSAVHALVEAVRDVRSSLVSTPHVAAFDAVVGAAEEWADASATAASSGAEGRVDSQATHYVDMEVDEEGAAADSVLVVAAGAGVGAPVGAHVAENSCMAPTQRAGAPARHRDTTRIHKPRVLRSSSSM